MAQRWRVGEGGIRVTTTRGTYSLPAGAVLDEIPTQYEGTLEVIEWKRLDGYEDKMLRPAEDKGL